MTQAVDTTEALNPQQVGMDLVLMIDQSGSMITPIGFGPDPNVSRWAFMEEWCTPLVHQLCALDADGLEVCFFNGSKTAGVVTSAAAFSEQFRKLSPMGGTYIGAALNTYLQGFLEKKTQDPDYVLRIVIFTDGEPSDREVLANSIRECTARMVDQGLRDSDLAISFIQVGDDAEATKFLQGLDEKLGAALDVVDAKPLEWLANHSAVELLQEAEVG